MGLDLDLELELELVPAYSDVWLLHPVKPEH
jgi:hypothetical protein